MNWRLFHQHRGRRLSLRPLRRPLCEAIPYVILSASQRAGPGPDRRASALPLVRLCRNCQSMVWTWPQTHLTSLAFPTTTTTASAATPPPGHQHSTPFEASLARVPCPPQTAGPPPVPRSTSTPRSRRPSCLMVSAVAAAASVALPRPAGAPPTPLPATCLTWAPCACRPSSIATLRRLIVPVARRPRADDTSARPPATGVKADMTTTRPRSTKASFPSAPTPSAASNYPLYSFRTPDSRSPLTHPAIPVIPPF